MVIAEMMTVTKFAFQFPLDVFPSSVTVQSFITIKWQEKKLSIITIFKFLVSDHLNCLNTIACQSSTALYATAKTKMYTPIFLVQVTDWCIMAVFTL